uniref:Uncharacterized protein n=1 Tax=Physcomitrium patens TaxID=3218 RepID=A0A2K1IJG9_PHYPA|nr:hypothetical protein PHYPA_028112 [Physcomitrium patens]
MPQFLDGRLRPMLDLLQTALRLRGCGFLSLFVANTTKLQVSLQLVTVMWKGRGRKTQVCQAVANFGMGQTWVGEQHKTKTTK